MRIPDEILTKGDALMKGLAALMARNGIEGKGALPVLGADIGPNRRPVTYLQTTQPLSGHDTLILTQHRYEMLDVLEELHVLMGPEWELDISLNRDTSTSMTFSHWINGKMDVSYRENRDTFSACIEAIAAHF